MLHIILAILKTIGLILLVILGLIILLTGIALFVPVKYRGEAGYEGAISGWARITWLLPVLWIKIVFENNKPEFTIRIFGFRLKERSVKEKKPKKKKAKKEKAPKKEKRQNDKPKEETKTLDDLVEIVEKKEEVTEEVKTEAEKNEKKKESFFQKLRHFFSRFILKIKKIKYTLKNIYDKIKNGKTKISTFLEMLKKEENKASFRLLKEEGIKLFKHIRPRKLKGNLKFGMDDPAHTGQILALVSLLYPIYGRNFNVYPDFEGVPEGGNKFDVKFKGRIRAFPVAVSLLKIYRDKNMMQMVSSYRG